MPVQTVGIQKLIFPTAVSISPLQSSDIFGMGTAEKNQIDLDMLSATVNRTVYSIMELVSYWPLHFLGYCAFLSPVRVPPSPPPHRLAVKNRFPSASGHPFHSILLYHSMQARGTSTEREENEKGPFGSHLRRGKTLFESLVGMHLFH